MQKSVVQIAATKELWMNLMAEEFNAQNVKLANGKSVLLMFATPGQVVDMWYQTKKPATVSIAFDVSEYTGRPIKISSCGRTGIYL